MPTQKGMLNDLHHTFLYCKSKLVIVTYQQTIYQEGDGTMKLTELSNYILLKPEIFAHAYYIPNEEILNITENATSKKKFIELLNNLNIACVSHCAQLYSLNRISSKDLLQLLAGQDELVHKCIDNIFKPEGAALGQMCATAMIQYYKDMVATVTLAAIVSKGPEAIRRDIEMEKSEVKFLQRFKYKQLTKLSDDQLVTLVSNGVDNLVKTIVEKYSSDKDIRFKVFEEREYLSKELNNSELEDLLICILHTPSDCNRYYAAKYYTETRQKAMLAEMSDVPEILTASNAHRYNYYGFIKSICSDLMNNIIDKPQAIAKFIEYVNADESKRADMMKDVHPTLTIEFGQD